MKSNLETFPIECCDDCDDCKRYHEWKKRFEKELRERMKQYAEEGSIGGDIIAQEYKEILGES